MEKYIPANSLVIAVGPSETKRQNIISRHFADHEVLRPSTLTNALVGEPNRPDLSGIVFSEIRRLAALKLSLGERTVIDAANLRKEDRTALAQIGVDFGCPVYYLVCKPEDAVSKFTASEKEIMRGDGIAEVLDADFHTPIPISITKQSYRDIIGKWSGVTVVGDIHGMHQSALSAIAWARKRNHYLVFLGDLIDYGNGSLEVIEEAYRLIMRGEGEIILGNHERKIARYLQNDHYKAKLSDGNMVTVNALAQLDEKSRKRWTNRFLALVAKASYYRRLENVLLAHGGVHPGYWNDTASRRDIENWAMFGEYDSSRTNDRKYEWVEGVPSDQIVIVGHTIRSNTTPLRCVNANGGETVFLDTGCGKGGYLSSVDLKPKDGKFKIENFNMF